MVVIPFRSSLSTFVFNFFYRFVGDRRGINFRKNLICAWEFFFFFNEISFNVSELRYSMIRLTLLLALPFLLAYNRNSHYNGINLIWTERNRLWYHKICLCILKISSGRNTKLLVWKSVVTLHRSCKELCPVLMKCTSVSPKALTSAVMHALPPSDERIDVPIIQLCKRKNRSIW